MTAGSAFPLLEQIDTPLDLRQLPEARLPELACELREFLIKPWPRPEAFRRQSGHRGIDRRSALCV